MPSLPVQSLPLEKNPHSIVGIFFDQNFEAFYLEACPSMSPDIPRCDTIRITQRYETTNTSS
jgi:hypothetical protein